MLNHFGGCQKYMKFTNGKIRTTVLNFDHIWMHELIKSVYNISVISLVKVKITSTYDLTAPAGWCSKTDHKLF